MNPTEATLAAAWRENLAGLRDHRERLAFTGTEHAFNQIEITNAPRLDPIEALETITGEAAPPHLAAEYASAALGARIAAPRAERRHRHLAGLAARAGSATLAELAASCTTDPDRTARALETLATGHLLHPMARTRLGWDPADFARFDAETPTPVAIRLIADTGRVLSHSGQDLRTHPMLAALDLPDPVVPVHPWQLEHRILPGHRDLFTTGRLHLLDHTVPAWPTASIRTLAGHRAPGFLKLALGIHITSTRRDISPNTAALAPSLHAHLAHLGPAAAIGFVRDTGGAWLPGSRDLTAIARTPLADLTPPGAACVPATALPAASPVTGQSLAAEYATWHGDPAAWIRAYAALFTPPLLALAAAGIGLEAHLQNSLIALDGPNPARPLIRDLGGARIHTPTAGIDLPPDSPVNAPGLEPVRAKIGYTLFQNHLAAIVTALERDCGLDAAAFWSDLADLIASLDLPAADRDPYLAATVPTKALLTMRLHPGTEITATVDNPMHRRRP